MINVNEYFEGQVKSLSLSNQGGKFTSGVMKAGEYSFDTGSPETMTVIAGSWKHQLPGTDTWVEQTSGESFDVEANVTFKIQTSDDCAYLCRYE